MRLSLLAIGRDRAGPETDLFNRYAARINPRLDLIALADGVGSAAEIKSREAATMLARIKPSHHVIALDSGGVAPDTLGLATQMGQWREAGRDCVFMIGGAEGLAQTVLDRADLVLSLGRLTLPHMLARIILAEQLYRAQSILAGHPYHRAGRP
jgi:23S rRNA (pseudouridine1915-N3)-methyltransferase